MLALSPPSGITNPLQQVPPPPTTIALSATSLTEAEASHIAQGLRIQEARRAQEALAEEEAKKAKEASERLQLHL